MAMVIVQWRNNTTRPGFVATHSHSWFPCVNVCLTVSASVTSSTHERKSRTGIVMNHGRLLLKHNSLAEAVPVAIIFKAMGIASDLEIVSLVWQTRSSVVACVLPGCDIKSPLVCFCCRAKQVGTEPFIQDAIAASLEQASTLQVATQPAASNNTNITMLTAITVVAAGVHNCASSAIHWLQDQGASAWSWHEHAISPPSRGSDHNQVLWKCRYA